VATSKELWEENEKMRLLRRVVDLTAAILTQTRISQTDAEMLIQATRNKVLHLFPGKESVYDLIYKPRFERMLRDLVFREMGPISEN
jgi:hypothetical protein